MIDAWLEPDDEDLEENFHRDSDCDDGDCDSKAYDIATHNYECRIYREQDRRINPYRRAR